MSGLAVYRGGQFPKNFWSDVFVPEPAANAVVQLRANFEDFEVQAQHMAYPDDRWGKREFVTSTDERFRPVDAKVGPDGALYLIDMYRGIIQHKDFLTDELREQILERGLDKPLGQGRIWRIVHTEQSRLTFPKLAAAETPDLLVALSHQTPWVRETAQRLLIARAGATRAIAEFLLESQNELASIHALWALAGRRELTSRAVLAVLAKQHTRLSVQSLRAGGELLSAEPLLALEAYVRQVDDQSLTLAWLNALARHNQQPAVLLLLADTLQTSYRDLYVREAVIRAAQGQEIALLHRLIALGNIHRDADWWALLSGLSQSFYRHNTAVAATVYEWLALANAQNGDHQWRQLALLEGLAKSASSARSPFELASVPAIFEDKTLAETDPLWTARLAARRAFTWPGDELASGLEPLTGSQTALLAKGKHFYRHCASCHGVNGEGVTGLAPELSGSRWVGGPVEWLARIVLDGLSGPIDVNGKTWNGLMPGHRQFPELDDETLTGLLMHVRRLGANRASVPSLADVAAIRQLPAKALPWTVSTIQAVPYVTPLNRFTGEYKISFITFTVSVEQERLNVSAPIYGTESMEQVDANSFSVKQGGEVLLFRFEEDARGKVNELVLVRGGQEHRIKKLTP
ncbi:MAG: mono/diheme cytochrome c family protein [Bacteroidia bacterium]